MAYAKLTQQITIGALALSLSALALGQSFEPIDGGFDIENAVSIPPEPTVVSATPNQAELGPAVVNQTADTNPIPQVEQSSVTSQAGVTATPQSAEAVGSFENVNFPAGAMNAPITGNDNFQTRQLQMQQQQLNRIEKVEEGLNKLVKKQSFSKSLMGTIISAATTADPVLAAVGGIAGFLIGKAEDYKEAEKKNYDMQQDILRKSPYFYTDEELKLAAYADMDLDPALMRPEQIKTYASYVVEAKTRMRADSFGQPGVEPGAPGYMIASLPGGSPGAALGYSQVALNSGAGANVNYADICYGHLQSSRQGNATTESGLTNASVVTTSGNRYSLSAYDRRNLAKYCFYSLR